MKQKQTANIYDHVHAPIWKSGGRGGGRGGGGDGGGPIGSRAIRA